MYYINPIGINHGNPMGQPFNGCMALPDELLESYIETKGFCVLTIEDNAVTALTVNQEALDDYDAAHPYVEPEVIKTNKELQQENALLKAQLNAATERSDFIEDCIAEMAMQVYSE